MTRTSISTIVVLVLALAARAAVAAPVNVILWFDTEDYILPADDDATLRLAKFLTTEKVRATFKLVGEKARVLEQRGRRDVIAALKKHEIGFHSDFHSVQPTPATYMSALGWDEGINEFVRREGPGVASIKRIFGVVPSCYGQPGSSWGPQSYAALPKLGVKVYLDSASHVDLDGKPYYYGGLLTLMRLTHTLRTKLGGPQDLETAKTEIRVARDKLSQAGGGIISIYYHPNEFVHREFWDAVNFSTGRNPPRAEWKQPGVMTPEGSRVAFETFEGYVKFIKSLPDIRFITASEASRIWRDRAQGRAFTKAEVRDIAAAVVEKGLSYQVRGDHALSASEVLALLSQAFVQDAANRKPIVLKGTPHGPSEPPRAFAGPVATTSSQLDRTVADVAAYVAHHGRVPSTVWFGSVAAPPEVYMGALAAAVVGKLEGRPSAPTIQLKPQRLLAGDHVSEDDPKKLWGWVIFPPGFRAPEMMALAKRQAWTLKPAIAETTPAGSRS